MAHTVGRRWPADAPRGDHSATCDDCGVRYRRSQLRRMPSGLLRCEGPGTNECARGREVAELDEANAQAYAAVSRTPQQDASAFDQDTYTFTPNARDPRSQTP